MFEFLFRERRCCACHIPFVPKNNAMVCTECGEMIDDFLPYCALCGSVMPTAGMICGECLRNPPPWGGVVLLGEYKGLRRELMLRAKFGGDYAALTYLGVKLAERIRAAAGAGLLNTGGGAAASAALGSATPGAVSGGLNTGAGTVGGRASGLGRFPMRLLNFWGGLSGKRGLNTVSGCAGVSGCTPGAGSAGTTVSGTGVILIPIPLHSSRLQSRGFNQSGELAKQIGKELHLPVKVGALKRVRNTQSQRGLSKAERRKNVRGAFEVVDKHLAGADVILIDDVLTTGSTLREAADVLIRAGARVSYVAAVAREVKYIS